MFHCSVIKDRFCIAVCFKQLCYYIMLFPACQELFSTFLKLFLFLSCSNFDILSHPTGCCQELFSFLFDSFVISVRSLRRNSDRIPLYTWFVNSYFHVFLFFANNVRWKWNEKVVGVGEIMRIIGSIRASRTKK